MCIGGICIGSLSEIITDLIIQDMGKESITKQQPSSPNSLEAKVAHQQIVRELPKYERQHVRYEPPKPTVVEKIKHSYTSFISKVKEKYHEVKKAFKPKIKYEEDPILQAKLWILDFGLVLPKYKGHRESIYALL